MGYKGVRLGAEICIDLNMERGFKFKQYCKNKFINQYEITGGPNYKMSKKSYT